MRSYFWVDALLPVLVFFFFYPTRQHAYRIVILAAVIVIAWSFYLTPQAVESPVVACGIGVWIVFYPGFMAYLLFAEGTFPDHWRRVRDATHATADEGGLEKLPSNFPLTRKLQWMLDLSLNFRMIGWVQEPRGCIPPHQPPSRRAFLQKTIFKLITNAVIADFALSFLALSQLFDYHKRDPTDGTETYLSAVPFLRRVPYVLWCGIGTGAQIGMRHNFASLLFVSLGSNPMLWPDMWGRWRDAYTLRKLWG